MPSRRTKNARAKAGGALPVNPQGRSVATDNDVEFELFGIRMRLANEHLHTVQREFLELTVANRLVAIVGLDTTYISQLHVGDTLYGIVPIDQNFHYYKYVVLALEKKTVDNEENTIVCLGNVQYMFDPATQAPITRMFYPEFGKFLIYNHTTHVSQLYEKINGFIPRPSETVYRVIRAAA
jgi:hypothetical protein